MKHKLGTKLTVYITFVVVITFSISIAISQFFLPRYYLHSLSKDVKNVAINYSTSSNKIKSEPRFDVTVLNVPLNESIDTINDDLKQKLAKEQIALNKFWVSEEVLKQLDSEQTVGKLYDQGKQKTKFVVHYAKSGNKLIMAGASMADFTSTAAFINRFNLLFLLLSMLIIIVITAVLSRHVTKPLLELQHVAKQIGELDFQKVPIRTHDEISELGKSINKMSKDLEEAQKILSNRNENLKQFMTGLTHELKTPLALIKVYASGIYDGFDDGTYLTTINLQVERMEKIITDMLYFAKMEEEISEKSEFNLIQILEKIIFMYISEKEIIFETAVKTWFMTAELEKIHFILENLISNAIKYSTTEKIKITFTKTGKFTITNQTTLKDVDKIWQPFYVAEPSRNKNFSGTGLGLPAVRNLCEKAGYPMKAELNQEKISFVIHFNKK